jgi:hypothetical protein
MLKEKIVFLIMLLLMVSCSSSTKLLETGNYDAAIDKSVKKLMKNPDNRKEASVLKKAWQLANDDDLDRIEKLKLSGQPDIWEPVYNRYVNLERRQEKIRRLPDAVLNRINFKKHDFIADQSAALKKAAEYNYEHAKLLLQTGNKPDARTAYNELLFINNHLPGYKNSAALMEDALDAGINYVLFRIENQSDAVLPKHYEEQIKKMNIGDLNRLWVVFDNYAQQDVAYDYDIELLLKEIDVSPELVQQEKVTETKEVEDGWEYVLDANGNVMKDSLGNDIKKTKYKTLKAFVTKTHLNKSARVKAVLDYYNNSTGQLIKSYPVSTEFVFNYDYATFEGDKEALTKNMLELVRKKPVPFPTDAEMIFDTSDELKSIAFNKIKHDREIFEN